VIRGSAEAIKGRGGDAVFKRILMFVSSVVLAPGCFEPPRSTPQPAATKASNRPDRTADASGTPGGGIWSDPVTGRLVAALAIPVDIEIKRLPVRIALEEIAAKAGLSIDVDLSAAMVDKDLPVSVSARGRPLRLVFESALDPLNCTVTTRGGVLFATDKESVKKENVLVVYPVADLCVSGKEKTLSDCRPLLSRALRESVDRDVWDDPGGGDAVVQFDPGGLAVIVSAPFQTQLKVGTLFDTLRAARREAQALLKREGLPGLEEVLVMQSTPLRLFGADGPTEATPLLTPELVATAAESARRRSDESRRLAEHALRLALKLEDDLAKLRSEKPVAIGVDSKPK
jgi:hypothetical protein